MMKSAEMKKSEPEKQTIQLTPEQEVVIGRLYDENYNDLFRYAAVLLSASDAEEAVQNLFVDACKPKQLKKLMEYEKNGQFKEQKAWLGKGIKFSISKIRRSKGQFAKSIEYLPPDADEEFGAEIGIEDLPDNRPVDENVDFLYGDLAKYSEFQLIKRYAVDGKSIKMIAEEDNISISACKKRLSRSKEKMRELIAKQKE